MTDKIPIGKYRCSRTLGVEQFDYAIIKFKNGVKIKDGDIITLDMIEPYESEAVRKVAKYLEKRIYEQYNMLPIKEHAKEIVDLVHEAEDADE